MKKIEFISVVSLLKTNLLLVYFLVCYNYYFLKVLHDCNFHGNLHAFLSNCYGRIIKTLISASALSNFIVSLRYSTPASMCVVILSSLSCIILYHCGFHDHCINIIDTVTSLVSTEPMSPSSSSDFKEINLEEWTKCINRELYPGISNDLTQASLSKCYRLSSNKLDVPNSLGSLFINSIMSNDLS